MDLSCLGCLGHNEYDAAGVLACAQGRNDVTRCNRIDMPPYGPLQYLKILRYA